ncbi:MAG: hypothetical protein II873_10910 [Oscillospiraceae bacterium]|nr:hypothetical protein [Oscillospiraceae bacterium]
MAKTIRCKYCGTEMPNSSSKCPSCGKKVTHPVVAVLCALIIIIAVFSIIGVIQAPEESFNTTNSTSFEKETTQKQDIKDEEEHSILVDDSVITAEFLGFDSHPELGMFTVNLRVTNKTNQKIWVYLEEASVNDEMMNLVMTGTPLYILPEKKGSNSFIFSFQQISLNSFEEVNSVSFKIGVKNEETFADIETTPEVTITK